MSLGQENALFTVQLTKSNDGEALPKVERKPQTPPFTALEWSIDVFNKDCRRSCSAILTWVLENVKISARPLNSIGN